jgi:serine/threonine protein kinase
MPPARESLAVSGSSGLIPVGATIGGRFRIDATLTQDAVSQTYRATDLNQRAAAAIRIIPLRPLGPAAAQLEADIEKACALVHKNLIEVLTVGRESDFFYIATELQDGQTLRDFIDGRRREGRAVSFKGACNLITHISHGLERAAAFMPHGGLNPAAVWVNKAGRVKVADLGLARTLPMLARRGAPAGAPDTAYVAPEVHAGNPPVPTSDVFSLGIMLYEVLTGRLPATPLKPASQAVADAPPGLDAVINKALARDPGARFQSTTELHHALASLQGSVAPPAASTAQQQPAVAQQAAPTEAAAPRPAATFPSQPAPDSGEGERRSTFGRSFNVAEVAGSAVDDGQERWLIQKDKLDFGPFSLVQIRAQIERGDILGEHMIVDSDTGARKKVKDFPPLAELSKSSERRLEQNRRAHAEIHHEKSEKTRARAMFLTFAVVLAAVVGGVGYYALTRKSADTATLATRSEEGEIDAFLKDVKLNFVSAKVAKRGGGGHHASAGNAANDAEFNNDANFGDASKYASGGDDVLDDGVVSDVMGSHYRGLIPCLMQERHRNASVSEMSLDFVIRGTGKVSAVKVNGQRSGAFASCVLGRMPSFPKFNGSKTIASWSMSLR